MWDTRRSPDRPVAADRRPSCDNGGVSTHAALGQTTEEHRLCPLPSSSAAALSRLPEALPDLPRFRGPGNLWLGAARWASPLLVLGGFYTLAIHGFLSLPALFLGGAVGCAAVLSSHATLLSRRRRLLRVARRLAEYAEQSLGNEHELYQRAQAAVEQLSSDNASAADPFLTTDVEQGIGYTRELLLGVKDERATPPGRAAGGAWPL